MDIMFIFIAQKNKSEMLEWKVLPGNNCIALLTQAAC